MSLSTECAAALLSFRYPSRNSGKAEASGQARSLTNNLRPFQNSVPYSSATFTSLESSVDKIKLGPTLGAA